MRLFDGRETLDVERDGQTLRVLLTGAQVRMASIEAVRRHATVVDDQPEGYELAVEYALPAGAAPLRRAGAEAKTRLAKLQVAQKVAPLARSEGSFAIPFLHPENILLAGAGAISVHSGLLGMLAPMEFDREHFAAGYKALVLGVLHPKLSFESLVGGGDALRDDLSRRIAACTTPDDVVALIDAEVAAESARVQKYHVLLPRLRHRLTTTVAAVSVVAAGALGWFTWKAYAVTQPRDEAVVAAQADFLVGDYGQTLDDLRSYPASELPKSARYVLATSSVKLADLTGAQKQAVLDNISMKTDDNTLDYWISLARGDLQRALDLAQNIGDDQLTLLAYTDLYEATKLNTTMDGAEKQKALEDYAKKIEELTGRLEGSK